MPEGDMRANYILIDYENVQPESITGLQHEQFHLVLFVGPHQTKIPIELAISMQTMGERARYVRMSGQGSNALDFHIAFYIGALAAADSKAYFHIVTKDTGFDPLLQHLKAREICIRRYTSLEEIPLVRLNGIQSMEARVDLAVKHFQRPNTTKPRTLQSLSNMIASAIFQKTLSETDLERVLKELQRLNYVKVNGAKVEHAWPKPVED